MKRLVCVVEGKGEVAAVPTLCWKVLNHLGAHTWIVDPDPIKLPRGQLVDEKAKSPNRPCLLEVTRRIDVATLGQRSESFDKLVRDLASLCG